MIACTSDKVKCWLQHPARHQNLPRFKALVLQQPGPRV